MTLQERPLRRRRRDPALRIHKESQPKTYGQCREQGQTRENPMMWVPEQKRYSRWIDLQTASLPGPNPRTAHEFHYNRGITQTEPVWWTSAGGAPFRRHGEKSGGPVTGRRSRVERSRRRWCLTQMHAKTRGVMQWRQDRPALRSKKRRRGV
jgi:hypothetical protein